MQLQEVEKMSKKKLRMLINDYFTLAEQQGPDRQVFYERAAFYMRELEHRRGSFVSIRDFVLEVIVITLIGWEISLGYRAEHSQKVNFVAEKKVLEDLQKSSNATAGSLVAVAQLLQNMNGALQKELALFYDVMLVPTYDYNSKKMVFTNNGRTNLTMWGWRTAELSPSIEPTPRIIAPGTSYGGEPPRLSEVLRDSTQKGTDRLLPFEVYLKNERGEEFTLHGNFVISWKGDDMEVGAQTLSIVPDHWSQRVKMLPGVPQTH